MPLAALVGCIDGQALSLADGTALRTPPKYENERGHAGQNSRRRNIAHLSRFAFMGHLVRENLHPALNTQKLAPIPALLGSQQFFIEARQ